MLSLREAFAATLVMAGVTFFTRAVPFLFFRKRTPPAIVVYAGTYLPAMVMTLLVMYALTGVSFADPPYGLPELTAAVLTAALHLWKRNALVSIFGGTVFYMALVQTDLFMRLFS
mgnify:CR=1 FL=1